MMKLILIFPIYKQCWKDSCPICPSWQMMSTAHYLYSSTVLQFIHSIYHSYVLNLQSIYIVYITYINCIYIAYKCLYFVHCSGPVASSNNDHTVWQGICLATPGNDACHTQGCYCGLDNRVTGRVANTAVLLVHRHPCAADQ